MHVTSAFMLSEGPVLFLLPPPPPQPPLFLTPFSQPSPLPCNPSPLLHFSFPLLPTPKVAKLIVMITHLTVEFVMNGPGTEAHKGQLLTFFSTAVQHSFIPLLHALWLHGSYTLHCTLCIVATLPSQICEISSHQVANSNLICSQVTCTVSMLTMYGNCSKHTVISKPYVLEKSIRDRIEAMYTS